MTGSTEGDRPRDSRSVAAPSRAAGTLAGIARHGIPKGPMETVETVTVSVDGGIQGDFRGAVKPGGRGRRQVTLIERIDWEAAMAEVGRNIAWQERRANLLVEGLDLPQADGVRLRIGATVLIEVTRECNPCERMEALAPGLRAALTPDWRGGACARVLQGGTIAVGDPIIIEDRA
ncbi:molybdenum cofactor biosysynthesis protein [Sphingomonas metalli]|uniref:Molybdenum cofactor biosysynthesis protein n=2 Tax=Sphingomonas metalli TaxID=1779358 RepID=A0A916T777_9SPHN|nr:molybdenum cofactor biosysynthesis protein [Sphingomonas metalli]